VSIVNAETIALLKEEGEEDETTAVAFFWIFY
jgi:hypothetical protein